MSGHRFRARLPSTFAGLSPFRTLALVAVATLLGTLVSILYRIAQVDGDPAMLVLIAVASVVAATLLARILRVTTVLGIAGVSLAGGLTWYVLSLPYDPAVGEIIESNLELLSGQSILRIEKSGIWALSVTPTPVFVTWYLTMREWYTSAALVGAGTLGYFVLTGDAGLATTLLGVVSGVALVSFGDLARREASMGAAEAIAAVLAIMVVTPLAVSVVPAGSASPLSLGSDGGQSGTVEASLLTTSSEIDVVGSIELSSETRFTIESEEARYWRVASFNRYTGDSWVRTGSPVGFQQRDLSYPPGEYNRIVQTVTANSSIETMPAAWRPIRLESDWHDNVRITSDGSLDPRITLAPGDSYQVVSAVPDTNPTDLARANGPDPPTIRERYTQLPSTTPERVTDRTDAITAEADNRYEAAATIERWLRTNREYSLSVDKPSGNVADAFLFEMSEGYCVYYATTMVTMLRSQDIPARMTVGYTPGEQVGEDTYRVRGYNSHAWVEVYFPERGWVSFDPTPPGPRRAAEQEQAGTATGDTGPVTPPSLGGNESTPPPVTPGGQPEVGNLTTPPGGDGGTDEGMTVPELPSRERIALGLVVLVGAAAGVRRTGLGRRLYRSVWVRWQPRSDPATDVERAFDRLSYVLEQRHRSRRQGETVRQYLDSIDAGPRARRVAVIRERSHYADGVTEAEADEVVDLVDRIVNEE
jgi:transglutaminase-like putative cysteine protease